MAKTTKKQQQKQMESLRRFFVRLLIFAIIVAIACAVCFAFKQPIETFINGSDDAISAKTIDENGLVVHFVDVGQGDSIAIKFPDGKTMLVDSGTPNSQASLINYLKTDFFGGSDFVFDYVLLTHSDDDHCGGMTSVCDNFVINKIYRPKIYSKRAEIDESNGDSSKKICSTKEAYYEAVKAFNAEIDENGTSTKIVFTDTEVANGAEKIFGDGYEIEFYSPLPSMASDNSNDYSPIMVINYNGKKVMLTGDVPSAVETDVMQTKTLPDVDLLKVAHHGSKTSTCAKFLEQTMPEIAVISVGKDNTYNHPTTETLNRLLNCGASIYRTDQNGTVIANVTSDSLAKLNIFVQMGSGASVYVHVEYLLGGIVLLAGSFCFGVKIKR